MNNTHPKQQLILHCILIVKLFLYILQYLLRIIMIYLFIYVFAFYLFMFKNYHSCIYVFSIIVIIIIVIFFDNFSYIFWLFMQI